MSQDQGGTASESLSLNITNHRSFLIAVSSPCLRIVYDLTSISSYLELPILALNYQ